MLGLQWVRTEAEEIRGSLESRGPVTTWASDAGASATIFWDDLWGIGSGLGVTQESALRVSHQHLHLSLGGAPPHWTSGLYSWDGTPACPPLLLRLLLLQGLCSDPSRVWPCPEPSCLLCVAISQTRCLIRCPGAQSTCWS